MDVGARTSHVGSGNRCGHDPANPRLELARQNRNGFVKATQRRSRQYYSNPAILPALGDRRSERREALVRVVCALLHHCDIRSLRIVVPLDDGDVTGVPRTRLQSLTGLSMWRIDRALGDCRRAGLLISNGQPVEEVAPFVSRGRESRYVGLPARRQLSSKLWRELGMPVQLARARVAAWRDYRKRQERRSQERAEEARRARNTIRRLAPKMDRAQHHELPPDEARAFAAAAIALRAQHPDWDAERVRREALAAAKGQRPPN